MFATYSLLLFLRWSTDCYWDWIKWERNPNMTYKFIMIFFVFRFHHYKIYLGFFFLPKINRNSFEQYFWKELAMNLSSEWEVKTQDILYFGFAIVHSSHCQENRAQERSSTWLQKLTKWWTIWMRMILR